MVDFYQQSQRHFTADQQPHYIYSPRELTRWKYALREAMPSLATVEDLARIWAHEAIRLFQDRLVTEQEKEWSDSTIDEIALQYFPGIRASCLDRPILYTHYLTKQYQSVSRDELRKFLQDKLHTFYDEELNVNIVVFDQVLDHILRIDRVLR